MIALTKKRLNSANVQAEFYSQCQKVRLNCILEYRHEKCRFDAVIHDGKYIRIIVEVKHNAPRIRKKNQFKLTKQLHKYQQFGLPVIVIRCFQDIPKAVDECISLLSWEAA